MYNYEEKIKRFVEDYATAVIGSDEYSCEIEILKDTVELNAVSSVKGGGSYNIATLNKKGVLGIDETQDESDPIIFIDNLVSVGIKYNSERSVICRQIDSFFSRYCSIHIANQCLKRFNLEVVSEQRMSYTAAKQEIFTMRTGYYRFYINSEMQRGVQFNFPEGGFIEAYLIDYIE